MCPSLQRFEESDVVGYVRVSNRQDRVNNQFSDFGLQFSIFWVLSRNEIFGDQIGNDLNIGRPHSGVISESFCSQYFIEGCL